MLKNGVYITYKPPVVKISLFDQDDFILPSATRPDVYVGPRRDPKGEFSLHCGSYWLEWLSFPYIIVSGIEPPYEPWCLFGGVGWGGLGWGVFFLPPKMFRCVKLFFFLVSFF